MRKLKLICILVITWSSVFSQCDLPEYENIVEKSLNKRFKLVDQKWDAKLFFCFGNEKVDCVKQVEKGFVAIASYNVQYPAVFYFYHISNDGVILNSACSTVSKHLIIK